MKSDKDAAEGAEKAAESIAPTLLKTAINWFTGHRGAGVSERKDAERRSGQSDRRKSGVSQRLRKGLWFEYHRKTETGPWETFQLNLRSWDDLHYAILAEGTRYNFSERRSGYILGVSAVADSAVNFVWAKFERTTDAERQTIYVIEEAAKHIFDNFNVKMLDRRKATVKHASGTPRTDGLNQSSRITANWSH